MDFPCYSTVFSIILSKSSLLVLFFLSFIELLMNFSIVQVNLYSTWIFKHYSHNFNLNLIIYFDSINEYLFIVNSRVIFEFILNDVVLYCQDNVDCPTFALIIFFNSIISAVRLSISTATIKSTLDPTTKSRLHYSCLFCSI